MPIIIIGVVVVGLILYSGGTSPAQTPGETPEEVGGKPVVQVNVSAIATNSTAVLNGTINPNQASTTFWYQYGESNQMNRETTRYTVGSGSLAIDAPSYVSGLKPNTAYQYQLFAQNVHGTSQSEIYSFRTTTENPLPPGTEPTVETLSSEAERITAEINGLVNPRGWATAYWFEYGETSNLGLVTEIESLVPQNANVGVQANLRNLKPLTKYYFRLNAQNQFGTVNGALLDFTTTGPLSPLAPSAYTTFASAITRTTANLRGSVNTNAAQTTYWFEYGPATALNNIASKTTTKEVLSQGVNKIAVSAGVIGLTPDTQYIFRLVAQNEIGTTYGEIIYFRTEK